MTNYFERERLEEILNKYRHSLEFKQNTGWIKIVGPGGHKIYVSRAKKCKQIHLSGFEWSECTIPPPKKNGDVVAWIDNENESRYKVLDDILSWIECQEPINEMMKEKKKSVSKKKDVLSSIDENYRNINKKMRELAIKSVENRSYDFESHDEEQVKARISGTITFGVSTDTTKIIIPKTSCNLKSLDDDPFNI